MWKRKAALSAGVLLLLTAAVKANTHVYRVTGSSMAPTLRDGELVISVKSRRPAKGRIALLRCGSFVLIKRVIALSGDHVRIENTGRVIVNSVPLKEPYLQGKLTPEVPLSLTVPNGCIFVLGDNRTNSADSRSPEVGPLPESLVFGKAIALLGTNGLHLI
jgi:signal peptidase I